MPRQEILHSSTYRQCKGDTILIEKLRYSSTVHQKTQVTKVELGKPTINTGATSGTSPPDYTMKIFAISTMELSSGDRRTETAIGLAEKVSKLRVP